MHNAAVLAEALDASTTNSEGALSSRPVIDQAIGIIRGRTGRSADDAFLNCRR